MIKKPTVQTKKNTDRVTIPVRRPTAAVPCSGEARASPADGWTASLFHYLLLIPVRVTGVLGSIPAGTGPEAGTWDPRTSSTGNTPGDLHLCLGRPGSGTQKGPTLGAEPRRTEGLQCDGAPEELSWQPGSFRARCSSCCQSV